MQSEYLGKSFLISASYPYRAEKPIPTAREEVSWKTHSWPWPREEELPLPLLLSLLPPPQLPGAGEPILSFALSWGRRGRGERGRGGGTSSEEGKGEEAAELDESRAPGAPRVRSRCCGRRHCPGRDLGVSRSHTATAVRRLGSGPPRQAPNLLSENHRCQSCQSRSPSGSARYAPGTLLTASQMALSGVGQQLG